MSWSCVCQKQSVDMFTISLTLDKEKAQQVKHVVSGFKSVQRREKSIPAVPL